MNTLKQDVMKFPLVAGFAAGITSMLFFLMQNLISDSRPQVITERPEVNPQIRFITPPVDVGYDSPEKPEPPEPVETTVFSRIEAQPSAQPLSPRRYSSVEPGEFPGLLPASGGGNETGNIFREGSALPVKQVLPVYPARASQNGTEGFVLIEFDINPKGQVVNPRVLYAEPQNVFDRSALNAISRWTFVPRKENGRDVYQYNERRRLTFSLSN